MNSKFIYLFILFMLFGCGVKSAPLSPPETAIKSYVESYTGTTAEEIKTNKKERKKK